MGAKCKSESAVSKLQKTCTNCLRFFYVFVYNLLTLGYRVLSKWFGLVRLACVLSRAPSTDGTPMFTQSSLLASVFEVVDFLVVGGRGLLSVGCGDLSYGLYCSWPLL